MRALAPARLAHAAWAALAVVLGAAFACSAMLRDSRDPARRAPPAAPLVDDDHVGDGAALDRSDGVIGPGDDLEPAALAALPGRGGPGETAVGDREARQGRHVLWRAVRSVESAGHRIDMNETQAADRGVRR